MMHYLEKLNKCIFLWGISTWQQNLCFLIYNFSFLFRLLYLKIKFQQRNSKRFFHETDLVFESLDQIFSISLLLDHISLDSLKTFSLDIKLSKLYTLDYLYWFLDIWQNDLSKIESFDKCHHVWKGFSFVGAFFPFCHCNRASIFLHQSPALFSLPYILDILF